MIWMSISFFPTFINFKLIKLKIKKYKTMPHPTLVSESDDDSKHFLEVDNGGMDFDDFAELDCKKIAPPFVKENSNAAFRYLDSY